MNTKNLFSTCCLTAILLLARTGIAQTTDRPLAFFDDQCHSAIVAAIGSATNSITMAYYKLSDPDIVQVLIEQHKKGVAIKIKLDAGELVKKRAKAAGEMVTAGLAITPIALLDNRNMHNKFTVIDNTTILTGSCNGSKKAFTRNRENLVLIKDPQMAMQYIEYWESL